MEKQGLTSCNPYDTINISKEREVNKMDVYVAMVSDYYGIHMVGVFSTYQKALDYLGECYANCTTWIEEEQIQ